jgi:beta-carotene 15,15'-dioxygenase
MKSVVSAIRLHSPAAWSLAIAAAIATVWLDHISAAAGPIVLLLLSGTIGVFHGALDGSILLRQFRPAARALGWGVAYLLVVVVLGVSLLPHPQFTLLLLLALSVWHFGEIYGRTLPALRWAALTTRLSAGGAPVMLPALTSASQLSSLSPAWASPEAAWLMQVWTVMAWVWLAVLAGCGLWCVVARMRLPRWLLVELALVVGLNLLLTPAMAFAIYFGLYHALGHVWRVLRAVTAFDKAAFRTVAVVLVLTVALAAGLLATMASTVQVQLAAASHSYLPLLVHWLIVGLTALTVPHLILISYCAPMLAGKIPHEPNAQTSD